MALFTSYQPSRPAVSSSEVRAVHSRALSPSAGIGFRVPRDLSVFVPAEGRGQGPGQSRQHVGRRPLEYANKGNEHDWWLPVLQRQAAGRGLNWVTADGLSPVAKDSGPTWTGTRAAKASTAGDSGYYNDNGENSANNLRDVLIARFKRNRVTIKAGDKLSTTAGRPGDSVGSVIVLGAHD